MAFTVETNHTMHLVDGVGRVDLKEMQQVLQAIQAQASIGAAAEKVGLTYRTLWGRLERYEQILGNALVEKSPGRGSALSSAGSALLVALKDLALTPQPSNTQASAAIARQIKQALRPKTRPWRLVASHDPALSAALSTWPNSRPSIHTQTAGSSNALAALTKGECDLVGYHFPSNEGLKTSSLHADGLWHTPLFQREQGLMYRLEFAEKIRNIRDLARPKQRFVNRQKGSGTRLLLDKMLAAANLKPEQIEGYANEEFTHQAVAALVACSHADVGIGLRAAASAFNLGFTSLAWETYAIAGNENCKDAAWVPQLIDSARKQARGLSGYLEMN
jgi:putative molybdopterin biosynthesis protein